MTPDPASGGFSWSNPELPSQPEPSNRPKHSPLLVVIGLGVLFIAGWLVLTVVGGQSSGKLNPIAQAAQQTAGSTGARFTISGSMTLPQFTTPIAVHGTGAFDFEQQSGKLSVYGDLPAPVGAIQIDEIFTDGGGFMASPQFASFLPPGKSWVGIPSSGEGGDASEQTDPHAVLQQLQAVSGQVAAVGHERIRGVQTTHYRATITRNSVDVPVDVWVDHAGLLRRLEMSLPAGTSGVAAAFRLDLYDFGATPQVTAPPASEVVDASTIAQGLGVQLSQ